MACGEAKLEAGAPWDLSFWGSSVPPTRASPVLAPSSPDRTQTLRAGHRCSELWGLPGLLPNHLCAGIPEIPGLGAGVIHFTSQAELRKEGN